MSIVKQMMAVFLLSYAGFVSTDANNNVIITPVSSQQESKTVIHQWWPTWQTSEEKALKKLRQTEEIENYSKPFIQKLCEPIWANVDYCLRARPLGVSNCNILIMATIVSGYLQLRNNGYFKNSDKKEIENLNEKHAEEELYFKEKYGWSWYVYELTKATFESQYYGIDTTKKIYEIYDKLGQTPAIHFRNVEIYANYVKTTRPEEYAQKCKK